ETLRFEVVGTSLKLYLNGKVIAGASDTSLRAAGAVGSDSSPSSVVWPTVATNIVRTPGTLPYSNNFDQPNGTLLGLDWQQLAGSFATANNALVGQGTKNLATLYGVSQPNVSLEADISGLGKGDSAGLVARYNATTGDYYYGRLINRKGVYYAEIWRYQNG